MHLVVLVHGMWGNVQHFNYIVDQLTAAGGAAVNASAVVPDGCALAVYCTQSNEGYFTYDGVDVCGLRVANEITNIIASLENAGAKVAQLSVLGYSMGGPIARYALGLLYTRGLFETIAPRVFVTVCSPHVGANILGPTISARLFNSIGTWSMARTSQQVFLRDNARAGNPLFLVMTDPSTPWVKALQLFRRRVLYANVLNDRRCSYYTSAVEAEDPFASVDINTLAGPYVPGYEPVVLASVKPHFAPPPPPPEPPKRGLVAWLLHRIARTGRLGKLLAQMGVVVPLWFIAFCLNASYQFIASRLRTHSVLRSGLHIPEYDLSQLLEDQADDMVEDMYSTVGREGESRRLALTPVMRKVEDQFNSLGWEKYPIRIKDTAQAHAAAIMRHPKRESFWEGRIVVRHLVETLLNTQ